MRSKVVIEVEGGMIQNVYTDSPDDLKVVLIDKDTFEFGDTDDIAVLKKKIQWFDTANERFRSIFE